MVRTSQLTRRVHASSIALAIWGLSTCALIGAAALVVPSASAQHDGSPAGSTALEVLSAEAADAIRGGTGEALDATIESSAMSGANRDLYLDNPRIQITFGKDGTTRRFSVRQGTSTVTNSYETPSTSGTYVYYDRRMNWTLNPGSTSTGVYQQTITYGCYDEGNWIPTCPVYGTATHVNWDETSYGTNAMRLAPRVKVASVKFHRLNIYDEGSSIDVYGDSTLASKIIDNYKEINWGNVDEQDRDTVDGLAVACVPHSTNHWQFRYAGNSDNITTLGTAIRRDSCQPGDTSCDNARKIQVEEEREIIVAEPGVYHVFWYGGITTWDAMNSRYTNAVGLAALNNRWAALAVGNPTVAGTLLHEFGHSVGRNHYAEGGTNCPAGAASTRALMCAPSGAVPTNATCDAMSSYTRVTDQNPN